MVESVLPPCTESMRAESERMSYVLFTFAVWNTDGRMDQIDTRTLWIECNAGRAERRSNGTLTVTVDDDLDLGGES